MNGHGHGFSVIELTMGELADLLKPPTERERLAYRIKHADDRLTRCDQSEEVLRSGLDIVSAHRRDAARQREEATTALRQLDERENRAQYDEGFRFGKAGAGSDNDHPEFLRGYSDGYDEAHLEKMSAGPSPDAGVPGAADNDEEPDREVADPEIKG